MTKNLFRSSPSQRRTMRQWSIGKCASCAGGVTGSSIGHLARLVSASNGQVVLDVANGTGVSSVIIVN